MRHPFALATLLSSFALFAGCSADSESIDSSDGELKTSKVSDFTVTLTPGLLGSLQAAACVPATWAVNLTNGAFTADTCHDGQVGHVARTLDPTETARARKALSKVRTTAKPGACLQDAPARSLTVTRGAMTTEYADVLSAPACTPGVVAVTSTSLNGLLNVLTDLTGGDQDGGGSDADAGANADAGSDDAASDDGGTSDAHASSCGSSPMQTISAHVPATVISYAGGEQFMDIPLHLDLAAVRWRPTVFVSTDILQGTAVTPWTLTLLACDGSVLHSGWTLAVGQTAPTAREYLEWVPGAADVVLRIAPKQGSAAATTIAISLTDHPPD